MKKLILIPLIFLTACANTGDPNTDASENIGAGVYMLDSILRAATQAQQQRETTKQTDSVMRQRERAVEKLGY